jgi:ribosome-associated protein
MIQVTNTIVLDEREIVERFVRSTGPGGQNLNRDATAVELRLDIGRSSLPGDVKARLIALAGRHVTTGGVLVVVGREHRSQVQNRDAARARLVALLKRAATPPKKRKTTKLSAAERERRLISKERRSTVKRSRSARNED